MSERFGAFGRIDAVVCSAGYVQHSSLSRLSVANWRRMLDVHVTGAFLAARAALGASCVSRAPARS